MPALLQSHAAAEAAGSAAAPQLAELLALLACGGGPVVVNPTLADAMPRRALVSGGLSRHAHPPRGWANARRTPPCLLSACLA